MLLVMLGLVQSDLFVQLQAPAQPTAAAKPASKKLKVTQQQSSEAGADASLERTVFVRSLPLDTFEEQLRQALRPFGPVKSCR